MDALYTFRHSKQNDAEIRYSLRSLQRHAPFLRKVWIFGDRPAWLSPDTEQVEHVPHAYVARLLGVQTPITNFFLMLTGAALVPDLDHEFLWFCDDFILIDDLTPELARQHYYLGDLDHAKSRGGGLWKGSLWRTYEILKRLGYPTLNYETHTPTHFRRKWVFDAYSDLRDFVTEDRWFGLLGPTAICNHAQKQHRFATEQLHGANVRAGFWGAQPEAEAIERECRGRRFLNFDDDAYGPAIAEFLAARFPDRSKYEREEIDAVHTKGSESSISSLEEFARHLNGQGFDGEAVVVGDDNNSATKTLLEHWRGLCVHRVGIAPERYNAVVDELTPHGSRCRVHELSAVEASPDYSRTFPRDSRLVMRE